MAVGLKIPVGVGKSGGAALVNGDTNDKKIIKVALGSGHSENAFQQDLTLGEAMVFDLNDHTIRAKIMRKVTKIFEEFTVQRRFKLKRDTIKWEEDSVNQELILEFKYVNLESDEEVLFRKAYSTAD